MRVIKRKELVKKLENQNYELKRISGSHTIYSNGVRTVAVPKNLNPCIALRLSKEIDEENHNKSQN